MQKDHKEIRLPFYAHLSLVLIAVVLIIFLLNIGAVIFIPLFFALLIAVLLFPMTRRLERMRVPKGLAALISILIFIAGASLVVYLLIVQIIHFTEDFPQLQQRMSAMLANLQGIITTKYHINAEQQVDYLNKSASGMLQGLANSLQGLFASVLEFVVWTIFVFIFSYFILLHRRLLHNFIVQLFKGEQQKDINTVAENTRSVINHYVLGLLLEMGIMMVVNCTAFFIMGIPYALLLGMIAAIFNIIPYLGIATATIICMVVTFANATAGDALAVGITLVVIHFIDANILLPRIVGSRVKMNPLITIIAVLTGSLIWGIAGMFLFIPLVAILKIIFARVEGMKPWVLLIGEEDTPSNIGKKSAEEGINS